MGIIKEKAGHILQMYKMRIMGFFGAAAKAK